jgi:hypothetical protein
MVPQFSSSPPQSGNSGIVTWNQYWDSSAYHSEPPSCLALYSFKGDREYIVFISYSIVRSILFSWGMPSKLRLLFFQMCLFNWHHLNKI